MIAIVDEVRAYESRLIDLRVGESRNASSVSTEFGSSFWEMGNGKWEMGNGK